MKRLFKILIIFYVFLIGFGNLAGAISQSKTTVINGKLSSLNSLKNVYSHLMNNGYIVRLEFRKPVSHWMKPVFDEKSVEIDFRGAFVESFSKSFPIESSIISKVIVRQSDRETLRVRFQTKPGLKYTQNRIKLLQQGRFIIIRFDVTSKESSFIYSAKVSPEKKQKENFISTNDDLLSQFLHSAPKKMKDKKEDKLSKLKSSTYSPTDTQKEVLVTKKDDTNKIEPVKTRPVPLVDQIKKLIFLVLMVFLVIFGFKNYFLKNTPRVRRDNGKQISPDHSEVRRNKVWLVASTLIREFFSYLSRISKRKEGKSVEEAKKKILQKIRKVKKASR